jgi:hypothetical protein
MGQCNREESRNIIVSPSMLPLLASSKHLKNMGNSSAPQGLLFLLQFLLPLLMLQLQGT